jgi:hypothetical protein
MIYDICMMGIVIGALASLVICVWRFTSLMGTLTGTATRFQERSEKQKDRFFERMIEKMQVEGNPTLADRMSARHAQESLAGHKQDLHRDGRADAAVEHYDRKAQREAEAVAREFVRPVVGHPKDSMT